MISTRPLVALLLLAGLGQHAVADDVTDEINQALKAYQGGDSKTAIAALDAAANLLRQGRADALKKLLPPVPPGWTADEAETVAIGAAMLGGGTTASRTYHNGAQQIEVQIIMDSPMLQGMAALFSSPFAAMGGMKTVVVGGRRMSYDSSGNSYMTIVADKVIVKVDGSTGTPDPSLRSFIGAIDFAGIEKIVR